MTWSILAVAVLGAACVARVPRRPDVAIISLDALDWKALSTDGGTVQAPHLAAFAKASVRFETLATLAPGGLPAAATLLTGEPPSRHGLRGLGASVLAPDVATLADRLLARGWKTGAFLQANDISISFQLDRGFEAWDAPPESFPTGHPGIAIRRSLPATINSGLQWLRLLDIKDPAFLWFNLPDPAPPAAEAAERAQRLGELDRLVGTVRERMLQRGEARGCAPIIMLVVLRGQKDLASAVEDAYLLREPALRVRAFVEADGQLAPMAIKALAGVDEISSLAMALATGENSRLLDLYRANEPSRSLVVAETMLPLTAMRAEPIKAGVRQTMMAASTEESIVQSIASDAAWPAGSGRAAAADSVVTFLAIDSAWNDLQRGKPAESLAAFRSLATSVSGSGAAPSARVGLGLSRLGVGDAVAAIEEFKRLEAESVHGEFGWEQALLGQATALSAAGNAEASRQVLERLLAVEPRNVRALSWLAAAAHQAGDRRAAVAALLKVLEIDPDHPDALESVGRLYAEAGQSARAAASFDQALRRRPTSASLLLLSARAHLAAGDGWTALDRVDRRVNVFSASVETDLLIADIYESAERWDLTAEFLKRALEKLPTDPQIMLRSAGIQLRRGEEEDARGLLARIEEIDPESAEPCVLLAHWLVGAGRRDEAMTTARDCATGHPGSADAARIVQELTAP